MNTAEYIIKRLEEFGINDFFGVPDEYNLNLLYAIEKNQNVNWIGCTNTKNAGYAADGYAREIGYGAIVTSYGAGELGAVSSIAGCMAENVPVINIVGLPSTKDIENKSILHGCFQEVDYQNYINAYKNITAVTAFLSRDNAKIEIDRVLKVMAREKKPVYIAIPEDISKMEISDRVVSYDWTSDKGVLEEAAKKIAEKINNSQNPVIIGDSLIKRFDSKIEYKEFVEKSQIPVSNFLMGTNIVEMDYEKYLGCYFGKFKNSIAQKYIEETDCLITVGAIYSDINSFGQNLTFEINSHIAIYGTYAYIDGEKYENVKMSELLEKITELITPKDIEIDKCNIGFKNIPCDTEQITSTYIYSRIQDFMKENDILISGAGVVPFGLAQIKLPANVDVQIQSLWSENGWAASSLLGVCTAKPQTRVILVTGEGSYQAAALELGTMLRHGLKPIVIVINNGGYTTGRMLSESSTYKFNDVMQMNYAKFARTFEGDVWATKVTTAEDFNKALKVTQIMNKMCYIEAGIDALDVLPLAKMVIEEKKNKILNIQIPKTNVNTTPAINDDCIYTTKNGDIKYETVVHKALTDTLEDNDEDKEDKDDTEEKENE